MTVPACGSGIKRQKRGAMKTIARFVCLCFLIWGSWMPETYAAPAAKPVTVDLKNAEGQSVGTATLSQAPHGVRIKLDIKNLPPGDHSLHIHQVPKCEAPDFKSAIVIHAVAGGASSTAPPRIACGVITKLE
jgi:Cu/Zn superoxide dismutase